MTEVLTYGLNDLYYEEELSTSVAEKQAVYGCYHRSLSCQKVIKAALVGLALSSATCSPGGTPFDLPQDNTNNTISCHEVKIHGAKAVSPVPALDLQVEMIIDAFSLTVSQAARVFDVSRPTVYSWRNKVGIGNVSEKNKERLLNVYELAKYWKELDCGPLGDLNLIPFEDDHKCLIDYLTASSLDIQAVEKIKERLRLLANPDEKTGLVGPGTDHWREAFRKQGFEESTPEEREANFEDNLRRIRYEY